MARTAKLSFEISEKDVLRVQKKLEKASGKPLRVRMQRATLAAGDLLVPRIKAAGPPNVTGNLRRSVKSRPLKKRVSGTLVPTLGVIVGPTTYYGPHRHLVIRGHRIVTPGGRFTGRRTRPNPYVDRASRGFERKAMDLVRKEWMAALR